MFIVEQLITEHGSAEGGLLGEDDLLELTAEQPPQTAAALKAAALRASNSAFAGAGNGRSLCIP